MSGKLVADEDALRDRYTGCLLGLACGDALGGPVEFISRAQIARTYPTGLREFVGGGWLELQPGEITDDTQMTLALARSLAECGQLDMDDLAAQFLAWYASKPKDVGNTTAAALGYLAAGESWSDAGGRVLRDVGERRAAGNGAVMRAAPIALRYRRDFPTLRLASIDSTRVTHADRRCIWGAVALNQALAHLLSGGAKAETIAAASAEIEDADVRRILVSAVDRPVDAVKAGGFVLDTVSAALWCLMRHETFEETVVAAVGLGDDADTTGAVAGALAGARYGAAAIPARWVALLQPRDELIDLANRLLIQSAAADPAATAPAPPV